MSVAAPIRVDLAAHRRLVGRAARVLDVGCGDGALLAYLLNLKRVDARGMEISQAGVTACLARRPGGGPGRCRPRPRRLPDEPSTTRSCARPCRPTREPRQVLRQMLRIGEQAIVSLPNFGHWQVRLRLVFGGRMPETPSLPDTWYDTPNIHLCTIDDFRALCRDMGVRDRAGDRAEQQEPADPHAADAGQPVRRAGGVHAAPGLTADRSEPAHLDLAGKRSLSSNAMRSSVATGGRSYSASISSSRSFTKPCRR